MKILFWAGIVAFSCGWLHALPLFAPANETTAALCFAAGTAAVLLASRRLAPAGTTVAGTAARLLNVACLQALTLPLVYSLGSRFHDFGFLAKPLVWALRFVGIDAEAAEGMVWVQAARDLLPFSVTWERLGLLPALWILIAALGLGAVSSWRTWARVTAGLATGLLVRLVVLVVAITHYPDPRSLAEARSPRLANELFSHPLAQLASFTIVAVIMLIVAPRLRLESCAGARWSRRWALTCGLLLLAAACAATGLNYQDPGEPKPGRLLIDESKSPGWETVLRPFTRSDFGRDSVYNFRSFLDYLGHHYETTVHEAGQYTEETLAHTDVLVVKTPTRPFLSEEVEVIESFVRNGGGLYLIGDHTNLLGMSTHLNALSERFGIRFHLDAANRLHDGSLLDHAPSALMPHPALIGTRTLEFMTSCTLSVEPPGEAVIVAGNTFSDPLDYGAPSFFGNVLPDTDDSFGPHCLCAARKFGDGRVLAFSDSTIFSNFAVMYDERPEFLLHSIDWLNRSNVTGYGVNGIFWAASLALALAAALIWRRREPGARGLPAWAGPLLLTGFVGGVALNGVHQKHHHPGPTPRPSLQTIGFVTEGCRVDIPPAIIPDRGPRAFAFDTFFVWFQRLGLFCREMSLEDALDTDAVVMINSTRAPTKEELAELTDYVYAGGRLLVMDSIMNGESRSNAFLAPFGLKISVAIPTAAHMALATENTTPADENSATPRLGIPMLTVQGGTAVLTDAANRTRISIGEYGRGRVVVAVDSTNFSRTTLGRQDETPGADDLPSHELAFTLVEDLLMASFDPRQIFAGRGIKTDITSTTAVERNEMRPARSKANALSRNESTAEKGDGHHDR